MVIGGREMIASAVSLILIVSIVVSSGLAISSEKKPEMEMEVIFNFNSETQFGAEDANRWYESSDTVRFVLSCGQTWFYDFFYRTPGMSKAVFSLQKSKVFQRA
jgi:hypothetical protein